MIVVFDLDGTLIDSAGHIHHSANAVMAEQGLPPLDLATITGFVGRGLPDLVARILERHGVTDHSRAPALISDIAQRYTRDLHLNRLYPGALTALRQLDAEGHRLGICTNKPLAPTRAALAHLELSPLFRAVIGGDSLAVRKPDPAPLLRAVAECGGEGPVVYVGDSEVDAETALAADLPFLLYTKGYRHSPVSEIPHEAAFDDWAALPDLARACAR
ncbi:MAG: phosphoglycolate phosphatase [Paracoccus sp. (in: a-proteobacteria)]|nr:phosphoglycolate phosphatase [Paracoccus sp. (in: a-proteobacteria)]